MASHWQHTIQQGGRPTSKNAQNPDIFKIYWTWDPFNGNIFSARQFVFGEAWQPRTALNGVWPQSSVDPLKMDSLEGLEGHQILRHT